MIFGWGKLTAFACGALFGSAGIKLLTSKDAKKAYVHTTAAVLRRIASWIPQPPSRRTVRIFSQKPRASMKPGLQKKNSTSKTKKSSASDPESTGRLRKRAAFFHRSEDIL